MSGRGRNRRPVVAKESASSVPKETALLAQDSPIISMFRKTALKLNERQDRNEKLVKITRDVTIESKRIIFLLHSVLIKQSNNSAVEEAKGRLSKLIAGPIKDIGIELENHPAYLHSKAVTGGFQEFIEAVTLCSVTESKKIVPYCEIQNQLIYKVKSEDDEERIVTTLLPQHDYMLGLADLTGELMRCAINSISSGDTEDCFQSCRIVRDLYTGYLGLFGMSKELSRKTITTKTNLAKVEDAVYTLKVRGREVPPTLLLSQDWERSGRGNRNDDEELY